MSLYDWYRAVARSVSGHAEASAPSTPECYTALATTLGEILSALESAIRPGVSTAELDQLARRLIAARGLEASFPRQQFSGAIATSLNEEIANAAPGSRKLASGDLLKLSVAVTDDSIHAMQTWTYCVGPATPETLRFVGTGLKALESAVATLQDAAVTVSDIGGAIESVIVGGGYSANRALCGSAMGRAPYERPQLPCYRPTTADGLVTLPRGRVFSVMVAAHEGGWRSVEREDGWTLATRDGKRALMFSQMVLTTPSGASLLTTARNSLVAVNARGG